MADLKTTFLKEVSKICGCGTAKAALGIKKSIYLVLGYLLLMLVTFGVVWLSASQRSGAFFSLFSFLLGIELLVFQFITGFMVLMVVTYYTAIIAQRGWNRYRKV